MELNEIMAKKRAGDYDLVAQMVGLKRDNVRKSLQRTESMRHKTVVNAFARVIEAREALLPKQKGH